MQTAPMQTAGRRHQCFIH